MNDNRKEEKSTCSLVEWVHLLRDQLNPNFIHKIKSRRTSVKILLRKMFRYGLPEIYDTR